MVVLNFLLFDMYFCCLFSQPVTRTLHETGRRPDHLVSIWKLPIHLGPCGGWQHRNTWQSHFCFRDGKYHKGSCKSESKGSSKGGSKSNLAWLLDFEMFWNIDCSSYIMIFMFVPLYFVDCIGMIPYLTSCFLTTHSFPANSSGTEHVYMDWFEVDLDLQILRLTYFANPFVFVLDCFDP